MTSTDSRPGSISTHAPAGGATSSESIACCPPAHFYSRPCGRGDYNGIKIKINQMQFLLTPLREGRPRRLFSSAKTSSISTHAPAGGATDVIISLVQGITEFLLTPLREGRHPGGRPTPWAYQISTHAPAGGATTGPFGPEAVSVHFYSRPCGRGDSNFPQVRHEVLRQIAER